MYHIGVMRSVAHHAKLVRQWHRTKNGTLRPSDVSVSSSVLVWWKCSKGPDHVWRASPANRWYRGSGCPSCSNRQVSVTNSLAVRRPDIAAELHRTKNGRLSGADVVSGSNRRVWWQCGKSREHQWRTSVNARTTRKGSGCPYCAGRRVDPDTSLAPKRPELAEQWHPTRNGS